jgi:hypothetical protein
MIKTKAYRKLLNLYQIDERKMLQIEITDLKTVNFTPLSLLMESRYSTTEMTT